MTLRSSVPLEITGAPRVSRPLQLREVPRAAHRGAPPSARWPRWTPRRVGWAEVMMARVAVGSLVSPAARARLEAGAATSWPSRAPVPLTRALYDLWALVGYRDADGARVLDHALLSARATRRRRLVSALEALSGASVGLYAVTSRRAGWVALRELETAAALDAMTAPGGGAEEPEPGDLVLGWLVKLGRRAAVLAAWHVIGRDVAGPVLEALAAGRDAAQAWRPELSAEACAAMALPLAAGEAGGAEELAWWDVDELGDGVELEAICLEALATSWQRTRDPGAPLEPGF